MPRSSFLPFLLSALTLVLPRGALAQSAQPNKYAIVIGANRPDKPSLRPLSFADDDALSNCELLTELSANVKLFTTVDSTTSVRLRRESYPAAKACARPEAPLSASIVKAFDDVVRKVKASGRTDNVIYVWFSGHGDGNALFLDGKEFITTTALSQKLLVPTRGLAEVHLILDACHSSAFVTGKGDDDAARVAKADEEARVAKADIQAYGHGLNLAANSHAGAFFGMTVQDKANEFSLLQAGVLSYVLRSALRNAADATNDGVVSYLEAEAFVWAANMEVDYDGVRMKPVAFPPHRNSSTPLASWQHSVGVSSSSVTLDVPVQAERRFRVFDSRGVRVLDVHRGAEAAGVPHLPVFLPREARLYLERVEADGSASEAMVDTANVAAIDFTKLAWRPPSSESRDAAAESLARGLFIRPYDHRFLMEHEKYKREMPEEAFLMSRSDNGGGPSVLPYVGFGAVASAGLVTGIVFNLKARAADARVDEACPRNSAGSCSVGSGAERQSIEADQATAKTSKKWSYAGFGVATAGALGGVALYLVQRNSASDSASTYVVPQVSLNAGSLVVVGAF